MGKQIPAAGLLVIIFCSVSVLHAQQLRVEYPEIRLSDKRVFAHARIESFDGVSFCISHESGIEATVPWEVMPNAWKNAFPRDPALKARLAESARANDAKSPQPAPGSLKSLPDSGGEARRAPAHAPDPNLLEVVESICQRGGFDTVAVWHVTLYNHTLAPIGNIKYRTIYAAETGSIVDAGGVEALLGDKTIQKVIPPLEKRTIEINDGFLHHEAAAASFKIVSWEFIK